MFLSLRIGSRWGCDALASVVLSCESKLSMQCTCHDFRSARVAPGGPTPITPNLSDTTHSRNLNIGVTKITVGGCRDTAASTNNGHNPGIPWGGLDVQRVVEFSYLSLQFLPLSLCPESLLRSVESGTTVNATPSSSSIPPGLGKKIGSPETRPPYLQTCPLPFA